MGRGEGRALGMRHPAFHEAVAYIQSQIRGRGDAPAATETERSAARLLALRQHRLARMALFDDLLGQPSRAFRSIHVGGTSGKGSTAAFVHAILHEAGKHSGLHTTPYLQVPLEKLVIGDHYYAPSAFAELVERLKPLV